jgi:acetylornithine deacetylase
MNRLQTISTETILSHLTQLVSGDSSDPVASMTPDHPVLVHAARVLEASGCEVTFTDLGEGCVNLLAVRGQPSTLFNCHLDTVKPSDGWIRDPFKLSIEDGRAYGLGACDIKGAAACMLAAAESSDAPLAYLFTTDEEAGKGKCVGSFLDEQGERWSRAVVAEPTESMAVFQHRGFASFEIEFIGTAGHTSGSDASENSAIHKAIDWGNRALELSMPGGPLEGACFNIGILKGGTASNVIAPSALVRFGFRPAPNPDANSIAQRNIQSLQELLPEVGSAIWTARFVGPALVRDVRMSHVVESWGIKIGPDVDFWTEAALFAAGGLPAIVLGPGSITQAHSSDEFVELSQLARCADAYSGILSFESNTTLPLGNAHAP